MIDPGKYSRAAQVLSLKMSGQVGPRTFELLVARYHTIEEILLADQEDLEELQGIGEKRSKVIAEAYNNLDRAQEVIDNLDASDTKVVTRLDEDYPQPLQDIHDPPLMLFYKGRLPTPGVRRVAVIGSQEVSAEGIGDAVELARILAREGVAVIGGLARGIDTAGHMGALKEDGVTFAVLPGGFNRIYPAENEALTGEIIKKGGLLSEHLPDTPVSAGRMISRNRLIVGLSDAVVIGEVSPESVGTLDTALCCQQVGKLMFVIIGEFNHHVEKLTEYGAVPLNGVDDNKLIFKALV